MKKLMVVGIILLFCFSSTPALGISKEIPCSSGRDPVCYPVLNGTIGWNGAYVSPVQVSFFYNEEVVLVQYNFGGNWINYTEPFTIYGEGSIVFMFQYLDVYGHWSQTYVMPPIKIDYTPPTVTADLRCLINKLSITADVQDSVSGIAYVEFFLNDVLMFNDSDMPYQCFLYPFPRLDGLCIQIVVYDRAGNMNETKVYFYHVRGSVLRLGQTTEYYQCFALALKISDHWHYFEKIELSKVHFGRTGLFFFNGFFLFKEPLPTR